MRWGKESCCAARQAGPHCECRTTTYSPAHRMALATMLSVSRTLGRPSLAAWEEKGKSRGAESGSVSSYRRGSYTELHLGVVDNPTHIQQACLAN